MREGEASCFFRATAREGSRLTPTPVIPRLGVMVDARGRSRPPRSFQPRFTLSLLYVAAFFFLFCMVLVAPSLYEVWQTVPAGPEQQEEAKRLAQEVVQPKLRIAFVAAVAATALGAYTRVLPGMKAPR